MQEEIQFATVADKTFSLIMVVLNYLGQQI